MSVIDEFWAELMGTAGRHVSLFKKARETGMGALMFDALEIIIADLSKQHLAHGIVEMNWQPIETAPTDRAILVFYPAAECFNGTYGPGCAVVAWSVRWNDWEPTTVVSHEDISLPTNPTHWMPLPEPPVDETPPQE